MTIIAANIQKPGKVYIDISYLSKLSSFVIAQCCNYLYASALKLTTVSEYYCSN